MRAADESIGQGIGRAILDYIQAEERGIGTDAI
jgi:hypothetical protein